MNVNFNHEELTALIAVLDDRIESHHNWIAGAVESGTRVYGDGSDTGFQHAEKLVLKLRQLQQIRTRLNKAKRDIIENAL